MTSNSYIGAAFDWDSDSVLVWERVSPEERVLRRFKAPRYFYVPNEDGKYTSIYGDKLEKLVFDSVDEFNAALKQHRNKFESDIQPLFKVLMSEYYEKPLPTMNFAFVDIEVDVKMSVGWSTIANPYAPINAVTVYQSWSEKMLTYVVAPKGYKGDYNFEDLKKEFKIDFDLNVVVCVNEADLLMKLVDSIQNADIISGWNSEFFDIPYIMKRLERVSPKLAAKMSFIGARSPKAQTVKRFGEDQIVYKLFGRTHLDYLDLFKKFAQDVRYPSYALGAVGEAEVGVPKVHFEGTFEEFYNNDFKKFIVYNARDVDLLVKINAKRKLMQLINTMAHENTCLYENLLGTVRYVETALINRAHYVHNLIVRDKRMMTDGEVVDGALVLDPRAGLHRWIGSVDINSLYPSVIRALNISPEMFIGQFISGNCRSELMSNGDRFFQGSAGELDWAGIIEGDEFVHTLDCGDGETFEATGAEWLLLLKERKWAITAYGTVFDQSRGLGIVPKALEAWYDERKAMQAQKKKWENVVKRLEKEGATPEELADARQNVADSSEMVDEKHLFQQVLLAAFDKVDDFELRQMSKKLTLNSTYGAMLSAHFGLGRKEMGASTTACGRAITKHMIETIGFILTGKKTKVTWYAGERKKLEDGTYINTKRSKCDNEVILLSDTDSCYFITGATNKADAIAIANETAELTNATFPAFMIANFLVNPGHEGLIKAGREIVGSKGLFLNAKKKYTIRVVDKEGFDKFELKMMGSELKKVDTPKVIQDFLRGLLSLVLDGDSTIQARYDAKEINAEQAVDLIQEVTEDQLEAYVNTNRKQLVFKVSNPIVLGASKGINNLDQYYAEWKRTEKIGNGKVRLPGHVRAAINYNELAQEFEGTSAKLLKSGDKGLIFYLKPNERAIKSIAIPNDFEHFPKWFDDHFLLDRRLTEEKMVDSKIEGTFEALGWDIPTPQATLTKKILDF